ncbi:ribosomal protein S18-alanine N-acetyltransferase [Vreelandella sp. TE19]
MIEALSAAHLTDLVGLEAQTRSGASERALEQALTDSSMVVLGLWRQQRLVGYALIARLPFEAELQAIGVLSEYRGQGLGRALLQGVFDQARAWQSERVLLEVREHNVAAVKLYEAAGFGVDGRRKNYYPAANGAGREDALLMSALDTQP